MSALDGGTRKKTNWILIMILVVVVAILIFTVFVKDKIVIENETGEQLTGAAGKFLKPEEN